MTNEIKPRVRVTVADARGIASRYNASHFRNHRDMGECARYSIPADVDRDDDLQLEAFIAQYEEMELELKALRAAPYAARRRSAGERKKIRDAECRACSAYLSARARMVPFTDVDLALEQAAYQLLLGTHRRYRARAKKSRG